MKVSLSEFLKTSADDSRYLLQSATWDSPNSIQIKLSNSKKSSARLITCIGVQEADLSFERGGASDELIEYRADDPLLLDYGPCSTIVGNSPMPDPHRFFFEFSQMLRFEFALLRDPSRYLNWRKDYKEWLYIVYSRSYSLLTAPTVIAQAAVELLKVQAVEHAVLQAADLSHPRPLGVFHCGALWVVCEECLIEA